MINSIFVQGYDDAANYTFVNRGHVEKLVSNRPSAILRLLYITYYCRITACCSTAVVDTEAVVLL